MNAVPRWFSLGLAAGAATYALVLAATESVRAVPLPGGVAVVLFVLAFVTAAPARAVLGRGRTAATCVVALALPAMALSGIDPADGGRPLGSWFAPAVGALAILLLFRGRVVVGAGVLGSAVAQTAVWGGAAAPTRYGVVAMTLLVGLVVAGAAAIGAAERDLRRAAADERERIRQRAIREAYHREREARLATTAALAEKTLHRIAAAGGVLDAEERAECRLLHAAIRDEVRGRRLLNDAVRREVAALRRRGAVVQVNDDGGLDALDPAAVRPLLDRVAEAIAGLPSDLVVIRTAPSDSTTAITVVATSTDPVAAALGLDEGEQVDLWLELDRPAATVRAR